MTDDDIRLWIYETRGRVSRLKMDGREDMGKKKEKEGMRTMGN